MINENIPLEFYTPEKIAKQNLNAEFLEKARITTAVSFLYYPVQHGPMSHAEIEIEGRCYALRMIIRMVKDGCTQKPEEFSYEEKMYQIRREKRKKLGFIRFFIPVTPKQLNHIQANIQDIKETIGLTCMHAVARVLSKYTHHSIPFPINLYPTTTALTFYLSKKIVGSQKVAHIDPQMSHRHYMLITLDAMIATVSEISVIMASLIVVHKVAITFFLLIENLFNKEH